MAVLEQKRGNKEQSNFSGDSLSSTIDPPGLFRDVPELQSVFETLQELQPELSYAIEVEDDFFERGNESLVFKLTESSFSDPIVQNLCVAWLCENQARLESLLRGWPDHDEIEELPTSSEEELANVLPKFFPTSVVLKLTKPEEGEWHPEWGLRSKDAASLLQIELSDGWYLCLQEELTMSAQRPNVGAEYEFIDGAFKQQCGYNRFGELVVADYGAVGPRGSGDEVLHHPAEVAARFDDHVARDSVVESDDFRAASFSLNSSLALEGHFLHEVEMQVAESLLGAWSGSTVDNEVLAQEVAVYSLTTGSDEWEAKERVEAILNRLQTLLKSQSRAA